MEASFFNTMYGKGENLMVKQNKVYIRMRDGDTKFGNVRAVKGGLNLNWSLINPVFSFEILVPMEMANYYGIRLIIEYAVDLENPGWTVYDVWLTDDTDLVREYQYSDFIQCPVETEGIQMKILEHANRWMLLFDAVGGFAEKLRQNKQRSGSFQMTVGKQRNNKRRRSSKT